VAASRSKTNEVDTQAVVKLFVEAVRQKRKRQTPGVKRTRGSIVTKLTKEIGITRDMALFMLRDMQKYKIRDIEPKYMNHHLSAKNALKNKVGQKVLARIGQGTAKPGKSAPWILIDATSNPADLAKANAFVGTAGAKQAAAPAASEPKQVVTADGLTPEVVALLAQLGAKPA
jgi:hypothetical protein